MTEKKFYQIRLKEACSVNSKIVNGVTLTKKWQVRTGGIGDFGKFPDVETQVVEKQGNTFVPVAEIPSDSAPTPAQDAEGVQTEQSDAPPDFNSMTVEQLKNYLIAKGVAQSELRNATKQELVERADFLWSQAS